MSEFLYITSSSLWRCFAIIIDSNTILQRHYNVLLTWRRLMKNSYPVAFACLVTGPGNCQCLSPCCHLGDGRKKLEVGFRSLFDPLFGILEHGTCTQTNKKDILQLVKRTIISTGRREPGNEVALSTTSSAHHHHHHFYLPCFITVKRYTATFLLDQFLKVTMKQSAL